MLPTRRLMLPLTKVNDGNTSTTMMTVRPFHKIQILEIYIAQSGFLLKEQESTLGNMNFQKRCFCETV